MWSVLALVVGISADPAVPFLEPTQGAPLRWCSLAPAHSEPIMAGCSHALHSVASSDPEVLAMRAWYHGGFPKRLRLDLVIVRIHRTSTILDHLDAAYESSDDGWTGDDVRISKHLRDEGVIELRVRPLRGCEVQHAADQAAYDVWWAAQP